MGLKRVLVTLDEDDHAALQAKYGHNVGVSAALRKIIRNFLKQLEAKKEKLDNG